MIKNNNKVYDIIYKPVLCLVPKFWVMLFGYGLVNTNN